MKNSKIFMSVGALVLACGAFMAAKPAKKFNSFAVKFVGTNITGTGADITWNATTTHFTTVQGAHATAILQTSAANLFKTLLTNITTGNHKVYYK